MNNTGCGASHNLVDCTRMWRCNYCVDCVDCAHAIDCVECWSATHCARCHACSECEWLDGVAWGSKLAALEGMA